MQLLSGLGSSPIEPLILSLDYLVCLDYRVRKALARLILSLKCNQFAITVVFDFGKHMERGGQGAILRVWSPICHREDP